MGYTGDNTDIISFFPGKEDIDLKYPERIIFRSEPF